MTDMMLRPRREQGESIDDYYVRRTAWVEHHRRIRDLAVKRVETTVVQPVEMDEDARRQIAQIQDTIAYLLEPAEPAEPAEPVSEPREEPVPVGNTLPEREAEADAPIPDALAVLVPDDVAAKEQKHWITQRYWELHTRVVDTTKSFTELSPAEVAELKQLERYRGWFA